MHIELMVETNLVPSDPWDPSSAIRAIKGKIWSTTGACSIGTIRAYLLNGTYCANHRIHPCEALEVHAATLPYQSLYDSSGSFTKKVLKTTEAELLFNYGLLVVDRVEVLPSFRGRDAGLRAIDILLTHFTQGCAVAALKPYPLQYEHERQHAPELKLSEYKASKLQATTKLVAHYKRLGFTPLPRTGLMLLNVDDGYCLDWSSVSHEDEDLD